MIGKPIGKSIHTNLPLLLLNQADKLNIVRISFLLGATVQAVAKNLSQIGA
jgi:hypothetical protein